MRDAVWVGRYKKHCRPRAAPGLFMRECFDRCCGSCALRDDLRRRPVVPEGKSDRVGLDRRRMLLPNFCVAAHVKSLVAAWSASNLGTSDTDNGPRCHITATCTRRATRHETLKLGLSQSATSCRRQVGAPVSGEDQHGVGGHQDDSDLRSRSVRSGAVAAEAGRNVPGRTRRAGERALRRGAAGRTWVVRPRSGSRRGPRRMSACAWGGARAGVQPSRRADQATYERRPDQNNPAGL